MKIYSAKLLRGYDIRRNESWVLPVKWSDDGKMDIGPPVYGEEADLLNKFPAVLHVADLVFDYIKNHPELTSEEFFVREAHG